MNRKSAKNKTSSVAIGIDWHDEKMPPPRKKKKAAPTPSQRLLTMSELVVDLGKSSLQTTIADIEKLQILARGQDINFETLEI